MPTGIYTRTKKQIKKIVKRNKSIKQRHICSIYMSNRIVSKRTKEKMRLNNLGKKMSEETKQKMSRVKMGKNNPSYGKGCTLSTRKKLSDSHKGQIAWNKGIEQWKDKIHPRLGKKHTKEALVKMSKSWIKKGQCSWNKGKKFPLISGENSPTWKGGLPKCLNCGKKLLNYTSSQCQECYFKYSKNPTSIESKVYDELKARGFLFESQKVINGRFIVDAHIPSLNLVIEADGDYWHSLPKTAKKDKAENAYLKKCGYNLLRLTETEINNGDFINKLPN